MTDAHKDRERDAGRSSGRRQASDQGTQAGASEPSTAVVIVCSDRSHDGVYEDRSGPVADEWLSAHGFALGKRVVVPDDADEITSALLTARDSNPDLVVFSGGTGLGPRDVTPQTLARLCDYEVPGIGELLRRESLKYSLNAYLSRCGAWVAGRTLVLALPGNPKAVAEQLGILEDILPHALSSLQGRCAHRRKVDA